MPEHTGDSHALCLECGLCCNGIIFADVKLQPEDKSEILKTLGITLAGTRKSKPQTLKLTQPCPAFANGLCEIYCERPTYCRNFECLLLKEVKSGRTNAATARRTVHDTLRQVEAIKRLLRELGDANENLALNKRFRRMKSRMEKSPLNAETANLFGELTLGMHELNVRLSQSFYPGD